MSLRKRLNDILKDNNIKQTQSSRGGKHIRFPLDYDYDKFFVPLGIKCSPLIPSISGTFESFILTDDGNDSIIWVNNCVGLNSATGKIFNTKSLTPDEMGISGVVQDYTIVERRLTTIYSDDVTKPLVGLLESSKTTDSLIKINKLPFNSKDLSTISKDYGEILASIWVKHKFNFDYIEFPEKSNEKMIDFYGVRFGIKYPISVKSGNGSKVNLQNIIYILNKQNTNIHFNNEPSVKIIEIVNNMSVKESIIELHKRFNTSGINELSKIMQIPVNDINLQNISLFVENNSIETLKETLNPFLDSMGTFIKESTWDKKEDKLRFVISPLGENIWRVMNNDSELKESLSRLARKITLMQVNVDVHSEKITFVYNKFKDNMFEFNWAGYSSGNKLGFKMI